MRGPSRLFVAIAAVATVAAACSSTTPTTTPSGTSTGLGQSSPAAGGAPFEMSTKVRMFAPKDVSIDAGQSIHITNQDGVEHNFSIDGQGIDTDIEANKDATVDTSKLAAGKYDFYCKYHKSSGMTGKLTVG